MEVHIAAWWNSNQAVGSTGSCSGGLNVWTQRNGRWRETGGNGSVLCSQLRSAGATHAIPGSLASCYMTSGRTWIEHEYRPKP